MQAKLEKLWQRAGFTALLVTHDVEEALMLAQRLIIFSDRPARVRATFINDRPYPPGGGMTRISSRFAARCSRCSAA